MEILTIKRVQVHRAIDNNIVCFTFGSVSYFQPSTFHSESKKRGDHRVSHQPNRVVRLETLSDTQTLAVYVYVYILCTLAGLSLMVQGHWQI